MGKVKDWLMDMEEDASWMSINEFLDKHGRSNQEVYEIINGPTQDIFSYEEDQTDDNGKPLTFTQNK